MTSEVLSRRALNRATLARQLLLRRDTRTVLDAVEHLVGLQAQAPSPPYYGLWSRLDGFRPDDLAGLLLDRGVVRIAVMRNTVHLVSARDCLGLRGLVQPIFDRDLRANTTYAPQLAGVDLAELAVAARAVVEERPRPPKEVGAELGARWPGVPPGALAHAARGTLPLVQVPPRGVWGRSGQPTLTTAESWLDGVAHRRVTVESLVTRYLAAFGPAAVRDVQTWSGLSRLGEVVDAMRPSLRVFRDESGRELFDLEDAPRPGPDVAAPVRFVAEFDNLLLSHADRTRVMSEDDRARLFRTGNGVFPGTFLVDGFLRGTWRIVRGRGRGAAGEAHVVVTPYRRLSKRHQAAVTREGARLLAFAVPGAGDDVRLAPVAE